MKLAELMRRDAKALAMLESRDNGKPLRETQGEVQRAADWITFFAGAADKINGEQIPFRPDALAYTRREPVGVVGAILPWNSPISLYSWKLGPALAAGNTVVLKPAEQTPVSALALGKLIEEAGFPAGVVNIVPGFGPIAGAALVAHPGVDKISFTGEHRTAQEIMRGASVNLKRCSFECGGKSPHILFADADLDKALVVATHGAFRSTGQSCSLGSRLFAQRSIYDAVVERMAERARRIRVGLPLDAKTHIGPQSSAEQLAKTKAYIALGREQGARLVTGGGRPAGLERGYFIEPTVFADVDNRSRLAQEEVFGPVLAIIPFDTEEEVIALANDVPYGLVAGLWTQDIGRGHRVAAANRGRARLDQHLPPRALDAPLRRLQAERARPRKRPRGARGIYRDQDRGGRARDRRAGRSLRGLSTGMGTRSDGKDVTTRLREAITSGRFQPSERLIEMELAASLATNRTNVRTALAQLEQEGLVVREANRGRARAAREP